MQESKGMMFNAEMVDAVLDGTKIQTRRPVKITYTDTNGDKCIDVKDANGKNIVPVSCERLSANQGIAGLLCPHGKPGDIIYVRETFHEWGKYVKNGTSINGRQKWQFKGIMPKEGTMNVSFARDHKQIESRQTVGWHKRPSMFMEQRHARTRLLITDVKFQRVNEITDVEAALEGIERKIFGISTGYKSYRSGLFTLLSARISFLTLWNSIYSDVKQDPWVWAITFEPIEVVQ